MKLEVNDIKKFELLPGETLVIRYDINQLSTVFSKAVKTKFDEIFPDNNLIFIPDTMELYSIIKKEEG